MMQNTSTAYVRKSHRSFGFLPLSVVVVNFLTLVYLGLQESWLALISLVGIGCWVAHFFVPITPSLAKVPDRSFWYRMHWLFMGSSFFQPPEDARHSQDHCSVGFQLTSVLITMHWATTFVSCIFILGGAGG